MNLLVPRKNENRIRDMNSKSSKILRGMENRRRIRILSNPARKFHNAWSNIEMM